MIRFGQEPFVAKGEFAKMIREMLWRQATGNLNEEDLARRAYDENFKSEHTCVWSDKPYVRNNSK